MEDLKPLKERPPSSCKTIPFVSKAVKLMRLPARDGWRQGSGSSDSSRTA